MCMTATGLDFYMPICFRNCTYHTHSNHIKFRYVFRKLLIYITVNPVTQLRNNTYTLTEDAFTKNVTSQAASKQFSRIINLVVIGSSCLILFIIVSGSIFGTKNKCGKCSICNIQICRSVCFRGN